MRINTAGVMPIIFAQSIMFIPNTILTFFPESDFIQSIARYFDYTSITYSIIYGLMIIFFTYFYTAVVFNPQEIAENVQKNGGFVPGLRPGAQTADFLSMVLNRITLAGAFFLALIAVLPLILQHYTGTTALTFGGTGLLIVVSVVIEVIKKIEAQLTMHDYEGF